MTRGPTPPVDTLHPGVAAGSAALLVGAGGALGAVARWATAAAFPVAVGQFPLTTLMINVVGSALLAALPMLPTARRHSWVGLFIGTGVLGGFTTMSAASVDTLTLLREGHVAVAVAYCLGTVLAALAAVLVVDRLTSEAARAAAEDAGWDE